MFLKINGYSLVCMEGGFCVLGVEAFVFEDTQMGTVE